MEQPTIESTEFRQTLVSWYEQHGRQLAWRETRDPYLVLVSELMLQQTQVQTVLRYFKEWAVRFPTIQSLAEAPIEDALHAWQGLGYYRRARYLHRCAKALVEEHCGVFPRDLDTMRTLPGVGRYTAGAIASFAFDQSAPIVEANIGRVLSRLLNSQIPIDSTKGQNFLWSRAEKLCRTDSPGRFNSALMDLGALVCTTRAPDCVQCPVRRFCRAKFPSELPRKKARKSIEKIKEDYVWIKEGERILLQQQIGQRWHGLWTLPSAHNCSRSGKPIAVFRHPITRFLVEARVFAVTSQNVFLSSQRWHLIQDLASLAMPSPHRRAVTEILEKRVDS
jgi:A/G-specific adenine glycosylase